MGVGVTAPNAIESQARIVGYDKQLRMKSVLDDIYGQLSGIYNSEKKSVPMNSILIKVDEKVVSESSEAVITMQDTLNGLGVYGNDRAIGQETRPTHRSMKIYRNNIRRVITTPGDGVRKLDAKPYNMYEKYMDQLADWNKAHYGWDIREGFIEQHSHPLTQGDTAPDCTQNWHPNVAVCGLPQRSMRPAYSTNRATYTTNIASKVVEATGGGFTGTASHTLNQPNLSNANNLCIALRITPLAIPGLPGGKGWIMTISERQSMYLGDTAWSQRNLGSLYTAKAALPEKVMNWPGVVGSYKNFLFVEDSRQPTILFSGTSDPYGMTAGYVLPTDDDQRNLDQNDVWDTVFIHGFASMWDWTAMKLHYIKQSDDYEAIDGKGTSVVRGAGVVKYDQASPNASSFRCFGSVLMLAANPDYV